MLNTLQLGRALAAIFVAAFHLSIAMALPRYGGVGAFSDYTKLGNRGVDFFFVLSGFIILFAHKDDINHPDKWLRYMYRRFVRVYPIYWLYTILFVISFLIFGGVDAKIPNNAADWLTTFSLIRFTDGVTPLIPAWTLFHEIAFYAIFSTLLINRKIGVAALAVWAAICIALYHYPAEDARNAYNVYTSAYSLFFLCGMGAYWSYKQRGSGLAEFLLGLVTLAVGFWMIEAALSKIIIAVGFALLLGGAAKLERNGLIHVPNAVAKLGDASYTIYLVHTTIQGVLLKLVMKSGLYGVLGPQLSYILVLVATIAGGYLAYLLVERPLMNQMKRIKFIENFHGTKKAPPSNA